MEHQGLPSQAEPVISAPGHYRARKGITNGKAEFHPGKNEKAEDVMDRTGKQTDNMRRNQSDKSDNYRFTDTQAAI
jgi:hypothetical protein